MKRYPAGLFFLAFAMTAMADAAAQDSTIGWPEVVFSDEASRQEVAADMEHRAAANETVVPSYFASMTRQPEAPNVAPNFATTNYGGWYPGALLLDPSRRVRQLPLGFTFGAWIDSGITTNSRNPINPPAAPTGGNLPVTFNYRNRQYQLNQMYGYLQRPLDTSQRFFDVGGRVDLLFGEDYIFTQALGLETRPNGMNHWNTAVGGSGIAGTGRNGLAMPQLYFEMGSENIRTKVGHFYTILGYETVTAPDNFFYSHAYTMQYGLPFTHTGALTTVTMTDRLTLLGGVTLGNNVFDAPVNRGSFLGGATWATLDRSKSLAFTLTSGNEPLPFGVGGLFTSQTIYSLVYVNRITDWFTYILEHDAGFQAQGSGETRQLGMQNAEWYGLNQYFLTQVTDRLATGLRVEWFNDDDGARVVNFGGHWWEISGGLNWQPIGNMRIRPEIRWDWFAPHAAGTPPGPFDNNMQRSQFTAGLDTIFMY
jgi:hypothetical protein